MGGNVKGTWGDVKETWEGTLREHKRNQNWTVGQHKSRSLVTFVRPSRRSEVIERRRVISASAH